MPSEQPTTGTDHTDSQGRCLTCEGSGLYFEHRGDEVIPTDCPDCSRPDDDGLRADGGPEQTGTERWTGRVHQGDAFEVLAEMPAESVHAVVTDPPYNLEGGSGFMGSDWDSIGSATEYQRWTKEWAKQARRVLKPGGPLVCFLGANTQHRAVCGIEDAGYSIEEQVDWIYPRGLPKGHNQAPKIDEKLGVEGEHGGAKTERYESQLETGSPGPKHEGYTSAWNDNAEAIDRNAREYLPASEEGRRFDGHQRDLKPAHEPVCVARKPISEPTIAENIIKHGTGALNTDGARLPSPDKDHDRHPTDVAFTDVEPTAPNGTDVSRYFYSDRASKAAKTLNGQIANDHPTVKPVSVVQWLVKLATVEGQVVLDPFAGSGTTCLASKNAGREFVGIEVDEQYADVARARIGLDVEDPSNVREDDGTVGLAAFADGGNRSVDTEKNRQ